MNHVKVLFFATLRDKARVRQVELDLEPGTTIEVLKTVLVDKFPNLNGLERWRQQPSNLFRRVYHNSGRNILFCRGNKERV